MYDKKYLSQLQKHLEYVQTSTAYDVLAIFLVGSQNYGIATENSDVDSVAIVFPSIEDLANLNRPVSVEMHHPETDEHILLKDVRLYTKELLKGNLNTLETLFTEYSIFVDTEFEKVYRLLASSNNLVAYSMPAKVLYCAYGLSRSYYRTFMNETARYFPVDATFSLEYEQDFLGEELPRQEKPLTPKAYKALANLCRMEKFITAFANKGYFSKAIRCDGDCESILKIKRGETDLKGIDAEICMENINETYSSALNHVDEENIGLLAFIEYTFQGFFGQKLKKSLQI